MIPAIPVWCGCAELPVVSQRSPPSELLGRRHRTRFRLVFKTCQCLGWERVNRVVGDTTLRENKGRFPVLHSTASSRDTVSQHIASRRDVLTPLDALSAREHYDRLYFALGVTGWAGHGLHQHDHRIALESQQHIKPPSHVGRSHRKRDTLLLKHESTGTLGYSKQNVIL